MIWSREEDMAHDFFRPISQCAMSAGLDAQGNLVGLHVRVSGQSINAWLNPARSRRQGHAPAAGLVGGAGRCAARLQRAEHADRVRDAQHACAGRPLARRQHQPERLLHGVLHRGMRAGGGQGLARVPPRHDERTIPKHLAVLNAAAEKGDWGKPLPPGVHRGIAQFMGYGSYSAATAEVSVSPEGKLKVHRMVLASTAATRSTRTRSPRRSKARWPTGSPRRSTANARSRRAA